MEFASNTNQYSQCLLYWLNDKLKLTLLLGILFYLQHAELSFMEDVVENSEVRKAFDLKFNLSSSSLYVKLLQNIKYTFLEKKKKKEREGRNKGEKIKFV